VVCHTRGARRPLFRCYQFHAGAALTARRVPPHPGRRGPGIRTCEARQTLARRLTSLAIGTSRPLGAPPGPRPDQHSRELRRCDPANRVVRLRTDREHVGAGFKPALARQTRTVRSCTHRETCRGRVQTRPTLQRAAVKGLTIPRSA
jgi:hypothetical protein